MGECPLLLIHVRVAGHDGPGGEGECECERSQLASFWQLFGMPDFPRLCVFAAGGPELATHASTVQGMGVAMRGDGHGCRNAR